MPEPGVDHLPNCTCSDEDKVEHLRDAMRGILVGAFEEGFLTNPAGIVSVYGGFMGAARATFLGHNPHEAMGEEMQRAAHEMFVVPLSPN